jgi:hypothetical protein
MRSGTFIHCCGKPESSNYELRIAEKIFCVLYKNSNSISIVYPVRRIILYRPSSFAPSLLIHVSAAAPLDRRPGLALEIVFPMLSPRFLSRALSRPSL